MVCWHREESRPFWSFYTLCRGAEACAPSRDARGKAQCVIINCAILPSPQYMLGSVAYHTALVLQWTHEKAKPESRSAVAHHYQPRMSMDILLCTGNANERCDSILK